MILNGASVSLISILSDPYRCHGSDNERGLVNQNSVLYRGLRSETILGQSSKTNLSCLSKVADYQLCEQLSNNNVSSWLNKTHMITMVNVYRYRYVYVPKIPETNQNYRLKFQKIKKTANFLIHLGPRLFLVHSIWGDDIFSLI